MSGAGEGPPLGVAIVGAGGMAAAHLEALANEVGEARAVAVVSRTPAAAAALADRHPGAAPFGSLEDAIDAGGVDAVVVCTEHDRHLAPTLTAARAGKHVLVEKPLGVTPLECRAMVEACDRAGVVLMAGQDRRYATETQALARAVHAGELGPLRALRLDVVQNLPEAAPAGHWLFDGARAGGGVVISVAVHLLDLARWLAGEVARVTAVCRTTRPEYRNGAEDYAVAVLEFESGAVGDLFASYTAPRFPWSESVALAGDDGVAHTFPVDGEARTVLTSRRRGLSRPVSDEDRWSHYALGFEPVAEDGDGAYDGVPNELRHFAACCRTGAEPLTSGRDNLRTMDLVFAVYESARRGVPVRPGELA